MPEKLEAPRRGIVFEADCVDMATVDTVAAVYGAILAAEDMDDDA